MTGERVWVVRVAQEFEVQAATADEALAFATKAQMRKIRGARLIEGRGAIAEKGSTSARTSGTDDER